MRPNVVSLVALVLMVLRAALVASPAHAQDAIVLDSVRVNGINQCYREAGKGPALVLLHGFGNSGAQWIPFVPDLAKAYRVIMPDLRGHGCSTNPSRVFTHRQAALDIHALLDSLQVVTFTAIGASSGAMTLLHMGTQQPGRAAALVLIAGTSYFPAQARPFMAGASIPALSAEGRRVHGRGDEQIRELQAQFRAFKDSYDDMNFTPPLLSTISARTLVVHGDHDALFPVEIAVGMYRAIPQCQLFIVPNGGHSLVRHPAVMPAARAFLSQSH